MAYTLAGRLGALLVRGATLKADVVEAVTAASIDLGTTAVGQLELTLSDPQDWLLASGLFTPGGETKPGSPIDYADLRFECAALESTGEDGGVLKVTAREAGAQRMRRHRGALTRANVSPTEWNALEAKAAGLEFVGQPSARRPSIVRQVRDEDGGGTDESSWDVAARLAEEEGYVWFVAAGVAYFATPTWLVARSAATRLGAPWVGRSSPEGLLSKPACRRSGDDPANAATVELELAAELGEPVRPGWAVDLYGRPTFDGRYLVTGVRLPLADGAPVAVSAATPVNPEPKPPQDDKAEGEGGGQEAKAAAYSDGATAGSGTSGKPTAAEFVRIALAQAGKTYIFGAEARLDDADPDAFDCSELVEWALSRCGVKFVDGSSAQKGRCKTVGLAEGTATRGALLFRPGHVAISLGDGRTIEAKGRDYGVLIDKVGSRFTSAGLIPGLAYGTPTAATTRVVAQRDGRGSGLTV